ncbi:LysR family transcriptional regulator [Paenibacillus donghaensis]|uniref:HTH lysR-type domain-containing protein n=1 Tax=Paenibacillus donghaensis TaxID=414771 RepID=A0A2Z2KF40_9BACL|nr:LysR family transcriptional regulator [Paenibacillus donghaensis]ASA21733.1 hypothetical protein B9T62_13705 [Paenibacillus donghaensis]
MNIMKLQIVVLLEKYKKVTDVAAELGLKQPTVSFHMKNLETELGASLFHYRSGRVLLTDAGRALHSYAVKIVALAADAQRSVKQLASSSTGHLELEAAYIPTTYILPKAVSAFMEQNPGIQFKLAVNSDVDVRERLRSREIQLAVLHSSSWNDESFHFRLIARDEPVLIFPPGHPLDVAEPLTPEQVAREPWIQQDSGSFLRHTSERWAELNHVRLWNRAELNSPGSVKRLIAAGGGAGVYSSAGIAAELALGQLKSAPLPGILPESGGFVLAWRKDYDLSPLQEAFAAMIAGGEPPAAGE